MSFVISNREISFIPLMKNEITPSEMIEYYEKSWEITTDHGKLLEILKITEK